MRNDGGPAFPGDTRVVDHVKREQSGMSLRDYFAAQSIRGGADSICDTLDEHQDGELAGVHAARHARAAYLLADAMIAERSKKESD